MADLSALPALSVDPAGYGARTSLLQSQAAQAYQSQQVQSQLLPIEVQEAKQKASLEQMQTSNATLAQVAKDAQAADPEDAASIWDKGMRQAMANGVPTAGQYVGHYRPDLAERVGTTYGGQSAAPASGTSDQGNGANGSGPNSQMLDMQIAQLKPDQVSQALGNVNKAISSFNTVKDRESWDTELQVLRDSGMAVDKFLPSTEWNPLNYAAAARVVKNMVPYRDALERASTRQQMGLGVPIPRNIVKTDAGLFEVNPFAPPGTPAVNLAKTPSYQRTNTTDAQGRPIVFDSRTGESIASNPTDAGQPGMPLANFVDRLSQGENATGDRGIVNPKSSATGNGQFINSTWLDTIRRARPELAGLSDDNLLELRQDPAFSSEMTGEYAKQNGIDLQRSGIPVTSSTLAVAHRLGSADASKVMLAPPQTPLNEVLSPSVMSANPQLKDQTTTSYLEGTVKQFGNDPVDIGTGAQPVRTLSPMEKSLEEKQLPQQFEKAEESFQSAQQLQYQLKTMQDQLAQLGTSGFMSPGTGAGARTTFAKRMNSLATAYLGIDSNDKKNLPFDPDKVATAQDIQKGTTRLGFDLARQLGSREAMMIVQQAVGAVPGIENTPRGARLIFGALNTAAQRQVDYYTFLNDWAQNHPSTLGADVAFNKAFPVTRYANQALLSGIPQDRISYLKANPKTASDFDTYYGSGLSKVILGKK